MHPEAITRVWAGGEHSFLLGIDQLRAVEQQCGAGFTVITMRLLAQQCGLDDVLAPIRLGLLGGGMSDRDAKSVMERALSLKRPMALVPLAADLMHHFSFGQEADDPGESSAGEAASQTRPNPSPTEQPDGAASSQQEP